MKIYLKITNALENDFFIFLTFVIFLDEKSLPLQFTHPPYKYIK